MYNKGDVVRIKPNFARPSRVGQKAKVVTHRIQGRDSQIVQYFIIYDKDELPDWVNEFDLEIVMPIGKSAAPVQETMFTEREGKRYLEL